MANEHIRALVTEFYGWAGDLYRLEKWGGTDVELFTQANAAAAKLFALLAALEQELETSMVSPPGHGKLRAAEVLDRQRRQREAARMVDAMKTALGLLPPEPKDG